MSETAGEYTPDEARGLWATYRENRCDHCGGAHARACPRVRKLRFHPNGVLGEVVFWRPGDWPDDGIMWPESLPAEPGEVT